jgi:hypothetical protein
LQSFVQLPHFWTFADVGVSHPVLPASQWLKPPLHAHLHDPDVHDGVPLSALHALPHAPQLPTLVSGSVQAPLQHRVFAPEHVRPHALQLSTSFLMSTQRPLQHVPVTHVPPSPVHASTHDPDGLHFFVPVQFAVVAHSTHW